VTLLYLILDHGKAVEEVKLGHFTNNYMWQAWQPHAEFNKPTSVYTN
jgi:hypothetical protein